eukprot:TRINITY_DN4114_c0_g1_i1.p1 TRINITY_DN4114_c0_g1~~TRINITY_DN4114_c0_g1_i1.p1  ORF type:complete len:231 (+),score=64.25 TRINITY_DN4114_c0_g1_i1:66-758(+)
MPRFTYAYWDIRGLAAGTRMLLWYCGDRDFNDKRYKQGQAPDFSREEWLKDKYQLNLDFPNLPYLIDEKKNVRMTQSLAIMAYIAKQLKPELLAGAGAQAELVDMLAQQAFDLRNAMVRCFYGAKCQADVDTFCSDTLTHHLEAFEKYLSTSKREGAFLAGALTWVDFFFAEHVDQLVVLFEGILDKYPSIEAYHQAFFDLAEIKSFKASPYYMVGPINNNSAFVNNLKQ